MKTMQIVRPLALLALAGVVGAADTTKAPAVPAKAVSVAKKVVDTAKAAVKKVEAVAKAAPAPAAAPQAEAAKPAPAPQAEAAKPEAKPAPAASKSDSAKPKKVKKAAAVPAAPKSDSAKAGPSAKGGKTCDEVKASIEEKVRAKGNKSYALEVVASAEVGDRKVVGSCAGGSKKLVKAK